MCFLGKCDIGSIPITLNIFLLFLRYGGTVDTLALGTSRFFKSV